MNELPKRIMAWGHFGDDSVTGQWSSNTYHNDNVVEYVRADLVDVWQPIETAPKDGTEILAFWCYANGLFKHIQPMKWIDGRFVITWDHEDDFIPTHWMSLLKAPTCE